MIGLGTPLALGLVLLAGGLALAGYFLVKAGLAHLPGARLAAASRRDAARIA
jgi:hypothetical protein